MSKKYHKFSWLILAESADGLIVFAGCHSEDFAWGMGSGFGKGAMVCRDGEALGIRKKPGGFDIEGWEEPTQEEKERAANCIKQWRANY